MASCSVSVKESRSESESKVVVPNWLELPRDITKNILQKLHTIEIVTSVCLVCPLWWNICKDPFMWRTILMSDLDNYPYHKTDFGMICAYAVERSCGQLEDITIEEFGTNDLLEFIVENGNNLRCLRLESCWRIREEKFIEVVKKFRHLEEVSISIYDLSPDSFEALGQSCSLLKSLKFAPRIMPPREFIGSDDVACIIAETMSKLCHLEMKGLLLTDEGVISILNGFPLLESFDIQHCYKFLFDKRLREMFY